MTKTHFTTKTHSGRGFSAIIDDNESLPHLDISVAATALVPELSAILRKDDAVDLALSTLRAFAPHELAQPAYVPMRDRIGTYVRGTKLAFGSNVGKVGKIVEAPSRTLDNQDSARAEFADGTWMDIYNIPFTGEIFWEPVEVEVETVWKVTSDSAD